MPATMPRRPAAKPAAPEIAEEPHLATNKARTSTGGRHRAWRRLVAVALWAPLIAAAQLSGTPATQQNVEPAGAEVLRSRPLSESPNPAAAPVLDSASGPAANTKPTEFEAFAGLPRFGSRLVNELVAGAGEAAPIVPPDYVVQTGDEVQVVIWGGVEADLRLIVDRSGRITIPRVGPVAVVGTRFADLQAVISRRVAQVFRSFELSVSLGRLRGVRVYVTGHVARPGAYVVGSLSTVMSAVMRSGGPSAAGSHRRIELRRGGKTVSTLDLYDLVLLGDRSADQVVQPDDVIHVNPVGPQVALRGSVNQPAVFEIKAKEALDDVLAMAGGFTPVADRTRITLERLEQRQGQRIIEVQAAAIPGFELRNGDVLTVFSAVEATLASSAQNKRVRIEGEVRRPGEYVLPATSTLKDALRAAGGLSPTAYVYGSSFTRESVRVTQQENLDRAVREIETELAHAERSRRVGTTTDEATQASRAASNRMLLERLRAIRASGRIVFQLGPDSTELPDIFLESGDRLVIPPRPSSVGVFGAVFNSGNYLHEPSRSLIDYIDLAGGLTKSADEGNVFVVRANGQVVSSRQGRGNWFSRGTAFANLRAEPGDTVFVGEELDRTTFLQLAKDWTQLLFQLGLGAAGIKTAIQ